MSLKDRSTECYITAASFKAPSIEAPNGWVGHLPLASWIIQQVKPKIFVELGTHTGNSYFSFCQTVEKHALPTSCYAVDTWAGDEHAGRYTDDVYNRVNHHNSEKYAHFSKLMRMTFDDALAYFTDASIELLHIDGLHTYEAVKHDFESWLPKLAPGAVVLFHDTQVRERNFGVWKLWQELKEQYPLNIEFLHSHGLGVLQLNNAEDHQKLDCLGWSPSNKQSLVRYFTALSDRHSLLYDQNQNKHLIAARDNEIAGLKPVIESAKRWQKRSWAKRAFHKWRTPGEERKKINFLKRIERSVRNRRDQLLKRGSKIQNKKIDTGPKKSGVTFIRSLAFHHSGKPRGWVRFLLFHKNKKPRRIFKRIACKKSGLPRKAFFSWMNVASSSSIRNGRTYDEWVKQFDELTISDRRAIASNIVNMKEPPIISVVMPTHNTKFEWLREAIDSVRNQIYPHWQLCIADDASTAPHVRDILEHYRALDARIQIVCRPVGGHISAASNSALSLATGDFIALLDHDDVISEHALYHVAAALQENPEAMILYSDEDKLTEDGSRTEPHFKSDWNPDLFFSQNYICHLCVIRRSILEKIGGFRLGVEGSQDHDLLLRCLPHVHGAQIVHIPIILYHWRMHPQSTAQSAAGKSYTSDAGLRSLVEFFNGNGPQGVRVEQDLLPNTYRVRWPIPGPEPLVSLIIPTRDRRELVETAISSIIEKSDYQNFEILILDNGSSNADTIDYFVKIQLEDTRVRVVPYNHPFNYSAINNYGVTQARGEVIGLINNDIEVISSGWLREMVSHCLRPEIGCVGAKLYYADDTIQHGGVIVGIGGVAGHSHKYFPADSAGYFRRLFLTQNLSAVTAACLLVRKSVFEQVGGLDDKNLAVAFNDVDFCLKVRQEGYRNLWTPYAELYHHESLSRGQDESPEKIRRFQSEIRFMKEKWGPTLADDPYYNPNLSYDHEDFSLKM